jgi:hypothetical protein
MIDFLGSRDRALHCEAPSSCYQERDSSSPDSREHGVGERTTELADNSDAVELLLSLYIQVVLRTCSVGVLINLMSTLLVQTHLLILFDE